MIEFRENYISIDTDRDIMKDIVELNNKSAPSTPAIENLDKVASKNSSQITEQGHLSPSEDSAFLAGSSSPLIVSNAAPQELVRVTSVNKSTQRVKAGNSISSNYPASFVDIPSRSTVQPYQRKNPEKNRVPFVISFSDDDSGSESEESPIQVKAAETKQSANRMDGNRKPPVSSLVNSQTSRQTTTKNTNVMPRKVPLSRTFVSSMTKINGVSSRNNGPMSVEQRSRVTNFNTLTKTKMGREIGQNQNIHLNSSKLQDLRQLIAIRENELKLKATQQNKETVSGLIKDYNVENLSNERDKISRETSAELLPFEPKEPEKKRQKVNELHTSLPDSDGRQDMQCVETVLAPEKEMLVYFDPQSIEQDENRGIVSSANLHSSMNKGSGLITDSTQCNNITKVVAPSVSNETAKTFPQKSQKQGPSHRHQLNLHQIASSLPNSSVTNKSPHENHSKQSRALQVRSDDKAVNLVPDPQTFSPHIPDVNPEPSHVSLNNASTRNMPHKSNILGTSNMDLQSLLDLEEKQDKELEEAQENRRKCEIEERNALIAHRKAQRASFEADARCAQIYRQRELISAQIRSIYLKDSSLLWSSRSHNQMPELNMHLLPSSSHQMQCEFDVQNQNGSDSDVRYVDQQKGTQNLALNVCSESDASTSDPLKGTGVHNVICSPSNESNTSEDEDLFSSDHRSSPSNQNHGRRKDLNERSKTFASSDDSLLLEASLRSQLFTRLGIKQSLEERDPIQSIDPVGERQIQNYDRGEEKETSIENITFSEAGKDQHLDLEGSASFLSPTPRSAFEHVKISDAITKVQSQTTRDHQIPDIYDEESNSVISDESKQINISTSSINESLMEIFVGKDGHYTNNLAIDPFWPLCMYELRGKCNNDECRWQHVRDYSCRNTNNENSDNAECDSAKNLYKSTADLVTVPPTYIVCLDVLRADNNHQFESVVARSVGKFWRKHFSISLVFSCLLSADLPCVEPFLHGTEACIEVHGGWNRQSSHFHSREIPLGTLEQHLADNEHSIETALLKLNQEVNKRKGRIEALHVLARALEADPSCVVLWIVYLHIYYSDKKSIGKDDMFHCAVEHNKGSYELCLMYINSRVHLNDCLAAYNTALSSLCAHASASGTDATRASESILDIFLQMINCLCISGKVETAIQTIYGLYRSSNIITHLKIRDKCILWFCCIYLSIYKKLPDDIVHSFEFRKENFTIEWPHINLTVNEKQQSIKLMEMAIDSLALDIDNTTEAAHFFALNHIRCIAVIQGLDCSRNLLEKYVKLYPSCLELVLMSARAVHDFGESGFEEVLRQLPESQRIWNQYAESALRSGKHDFAKEIMDRWFKYSKPEKNLDIFGLINLSLHKILQDDPNGAILAVDHALESASIDDYKQCVMEHATFSSSMSKTLNLLNRYLNDTRAISTSVPLSRNFIQIIKKPKVRQLVSNLLTPLSSDFSLMNSILKIWYGPSLLPSNLELGNLVEFVESIMDNRPANYPVAISLCKVLAGAGDSGKVSSSVSFWASSLLVNALFQAVPVAPEYVWVEAARVLMNLASGKSVSENFHRRALSVYPFSLCLWESYLNFSKVNGNVKAVVEAAKERGIVLN